MNIVETPKGFRVINGKSLNPADWTKKEREEASRLLRKSLVNEEERRNALINRLSREYTEIIQDSIF